MNNESPWRDVRKETPKKDQRIVIAVHIRNPKTGVWHYVFDVTNYDRYGDGYGWMSSGEVHYWMPLPPIPNIYER